MQEGVCNMGIVCVCVAMELGCVCDEDDEAYAWGLWAENKVIKSFSKHSQSASK